MEALFSRMNLARCLSRRNGVCQAAVSRLVLPNASASPVLELQYRKEHPSPASTHLPQRQWFSTDPETRRIPSNLKFDTRSSFAPVSESEFKDRLADQERLFAGQDELTDERDQDELDEDEDYDDDDGEEEEEAMFLPPPDIVYAVPLPERLHVPILDLFVPEHDSNNVGTIWLDETVFGCEPVRVDLLKRAVNYWRAKKRGRRKAHSKTIAEISGSGRKLRPQKGQGRARVGHSRPPQFRGGVKVHGPKNTRDYGKTKMNKKVRKAAVRNALSQKLLEGNLIVANHFHHLPSIKTKELSAYLRNYGIGGVGGSRALILDSYSPEDSENDGYPAQYKGVPVNFWVAANNIPNITVRNHIGAVVYHILRHEKLIISLSCLEMLERRLKL